jgi:hypothetical protein
VANAWAASIALIALVAINRPVFIDVLPVKNSFVVDF